MAKLRDNLAASGPVDGFKCSLCVEADNEEMVQCDGCNDWYHLVCVGVEESLADMEWHCHECRKKTDKSKKTVPSTNSVEDKLVEIQAIEDELALLKRKMSLLEMKRASIGNNANVQQQSHQRYSNTGAYPKSSQQPEFEPQIPARTQPPLFVPQAAQAQPQPSSYFGTRAQPQRSTPYGAGTQPQPPLFNRNQQQTSGGSNQNTFGINQNAFDSQQNAQSPRFSRPGFNSTQSQSNRPDNGNEDELEATFAGFHARAFAARNTISKDLPTFGGKPEQWPVFYSAYEYSTEICNFSNHENLMRLQKALTGHARTLVEAQLGIPSCVPTIIETLKLVFGRPEYIVQDQLERIRKIPAPKAEKLETIVMYSVAVNNLCCTMEQAKLLEHIRNPMLVQELVDKLPPTLKLEWGSYCRTLTSASPSVIDVNNWLKNKMVDICSVSRISFGGDNKSNQKVSKNITGTHTDPIENKKSCKACDGDCSALTDCNKFKELKVWKRWDLVKANKICFCCLKIHRHKCTRPVKCTIDNCTKPHHPLLHKTPKDPNDSQEVKKSTEQNMIHYQTPPGIICRIVPVSLYANDLKVDTYAYLDDGSSVTMLDETIAKRLSLQGDCKPLHVQWTGKVKRTIEGSRLVRVNISGCYENARRYPIKARTYPGLEIPKQTVDVSELQNECTHLQGLPIKSYKNAKVGVIIGLENWNIAIPLKVREGHRNQPIAAKTRLGWTVAGPWQVQTENDDFQSLVHVFDQPSDESKKINELMRNYFSLENIGIVKYPNSTDSYEEKRARKILESTTKKIGDRFETGLLWKTDNPILPDSSSMAMTRLKCLECKLDSDPALKIEVKKQFEDYLKNDFIRKLDSNENNPKSNKTWYLPLFTVTNPSKPGKVRIVWDAAAKVDGVSLNSCLLKGPDLVASLMNILMRFRIHRIAFAGDIKQMFHQVKINKDDQIAQLFLWRDCDTSRPPDTYVTTVMTFGSTCSPCSAQFVKNKNAEEFKAQYPRAVASIVDNHYVDDVLDGGDSVDEAITIAQQMKLIHSKGGFHMRNWRSNSEEFMQIMGDEPVSTDLELKPSAQDPNEKVLGMWWNMKEDCINFSLRFNKTNKELLVGEKIPTKREVARTLMSVYDPLGLLGHFMVYLKILLQDIWRQGSDWDEPLTNEMVERWQCWIKVLPQIEQVRIPRCYLGHVPGWEHSNIQLHVFVDASKNALAAVAYLRLQHNETIHCIIIGSKVKVAPIRLTTIPRLELNAALIGARFAVTIIQSLPIHISQAFFWCDSTTVLAWIKSAPKYSQYVGFRATEIQDITNPSDWRYISTKENVADFATKWKQNPSLDPNSSWFTGPEFLCKPENKWPNTNETAVDTEEEICITGLHFDNPSIVDIDRFATWEKLHRTMAFVYRFKNIKNYPKSEVKLPKNFIQSSEWKLAENFIIKLAQQESFTVEISTLKSGKQLKRSSSIYKLTPCLHDEILRVDGRLNYAPVSFDTKKPIIMPSKSKITSLLVDYYHRKYLHANDETVVNEIRQKFYISKLRRLVKKSRQDCQACKVKNAVPSIPRMAPLPPARLAAFTRPFTFTGVDYFGPLLVTVGRRSEKRYGVLFTCLTIRAVHIEIAHSLDTNSCVMAIRNFMHRRGTPKEFYSDCGTNFVSSEKVLRQCIRNVDQQQLASEFTTAETEWKFNPPSAPHMGGAWERLVRSVKVALYTIQPPSRHLSDEVLRSSLMEVENIVNSRPLTYVPLNHELDEALTPNHFLLGNSSGTKPLGVLNDNGALLKMSWRTSQLMADRFWKRWLREYLPTLTRRTKWYEPSKPLAPGDVVIIVDERNDRNQWPKGIVQSVTVAADGNVRKAVVKTSSGILQRPVSKLAVIDIEKGGYSLHELATGGEKC